VLSQTIRPGLPFFMGGVLSVMDMSAMILSYGAPELSLMMAGATEMAHYVGLPLWQTGGCTDSKCLDEQAALEGSLSCFFSALSGGDLCHDVGYTESGMTGSIFQTVMMDEAIGYSRRITRGIEVNEETLAADVIHNVGPDGHYLYVDGPFFDAHQVDFEEAVRRNKMYVRQEQASKDRAACRKLAVGQD